MWTRIKALIRKEFLAVLRDKRSRFVLIVPPIIQLIIFAFAATLDVKNVPIGIVNLDNGEQSFELIERLKGSPFFSKIIHLPSIESATPFIENMEGVMVVFFDQQFSRNLDANKPADIFLALDGRKSNTTQIVSGYVASIVDQFNQDLAAKKQLPQQNVRLVVRNWFNPNLIYYWYNIPSLSGILTMFVTLTLTALSVSREKELGTFDQLLVSPLVPLEIIIGKIAPAIVLGMIEGSLITFVGVFFYHVPFEGSLLLMYASMFFFVCAIAGIGLFISSIANTQQQAVLGSFIFISPSVLLSGFATPIENMPWWLQYVTYVIPLRYFLVIVKGSFLKNLPAEVVLNNTWPMIIIALCTLVSSAWFFRHRLE